MSAGGELSARGVTVTRGARVVLSGLDLALRAGETTIVIGPNGAGKSTLIRALAGLLPISGAVTLNDKIVANMPAGERARAIGVFLEQPDATFGFSARELVAMGRFPHLGGGFEGPGDVAAIDAALRRLDLEGLAERPYVRLSSGERQRVGLARVVCQDAPVVLLDEPTARLDPYHALRIAEVVRELARAGRIVLAAEHDLDLAAQLADRLLILSHGRIVADGPPAEVLTPERVADVYGVNARRVDGGRASIVIDGLAPRPPRP